MNKYSLSNIRKIWIKFFENKKHYNIESQSLIPKDDNSLLWINSGVATLKKYFSGLEIPPSNRLVNSQRCIRTNDIHNVGNTSRHHTFFEMLGNFSIGDYFRKEAINFAFEFLIKELNIDIKKIYITVFEEDLESFDIWKSLGIIESHIIKCDKSRNFWEIGQGPCGPCTEIYYDRGEKFDPLNKGESLFFDDIENDRYIEIWNIVFSEFENDGQNNYNLLHKKNIDTGAGLERLACILQNVPTNYDIDVFVYVKKEIQNFSIEKYNSDIYFDFDNNKNYRQIFINKCFSVIVDHLKACVFSISDGALPSNKGRGYVIRKLLRRYFFYLSFLKIENLKINDILINKTIETMQDFYPYLLNAKNNVIEIINQEHIVYNNLLNKSSKQFEDLINSKNIDEKFLFNLVETYGFPIEIIQEIEHCTNEKLINEIIFNITKNKKIVFNKKDINFNKFNDLFQIHKNISKANKIVNTMDKQNSALIDLNVDSYFDYKSYEMDSKVIKIFDKNFNEVKNVSNDLSYLVLDKTCFYATSGGQIKDEGFINNFEVKDIFKGPNGQHIHKLENCNFFLGEIVHCKIDARKRELVSKNHSVEHLLHSSLKRNILESIKQEGAFKSPEKVTFDFNYHKKLSIDEIIKIETDIKNIIKSNIDSETLLVTLNEAKKIGALAYFENIYKKIKDKLRVVKFGQYSIEICGGTHVSNTKEIEDFKIIKLESKGSGLWRIDAITSHETCDIFEKDTVSKIKIKYKEYMDFFSKNKLHKNELEEIKKIDFNNRHFLEQKNIMEKLSIMFNSINVKLEKENILNQSKILKKELSIFNKKFNFISLNNINGKILFNSLTNLINENNFSIYFVINNIDDCIQYYLCTNEQYQIDKNINFKSIVKDINYELEGKGGGKWNFIQGSFSKKNLDKCNSFAKKLEKYIYENY